MLSGGTPVQVLSDTFPKFLHVILDTSRIKGLFHCYQTLPPVMIGAGNETTLLSISIGVSVNLFNARMYR